MAYKSLQDYCNELIEQGDNWGQQLLDEFGNGDGIYEDELGMWHAPSDFAYGSGKKIKWTCDKKHTWEATILSRTNCKSRCPYCITSSTSYPEQFIYWGIKVIYPNTQNRYHLFKSEENLRGFEYDIYIPELKLLIEYSGEKWHEGKEERDQMKKELAEKNGYHFIKIIEIKDNKEYIEKSIIKICTRKVDVEKILDFILHQFNHSINELDLKEIEYLAREYSKGKIEYEKSLEYLYSNMTKEWDYENNSLKPSEITPGSHYKAHWICEKGHRWQVQVLFRTKDNTGCPVCHQNKIKARSRINYLPTL